VVKVVVRVVGKGRGNYLYLCLGQMKGLDERVEEDGDEADNNLVNWWFHLVCKLEFGVELKSRVGNQTLE
jgi:hypothetical protein